MEERTQSAQSSTAGEGLIEHACKISRAISKIRRESLDGDQIGGDMLEPACRYRNIGFALFC